MNCDLCTSPLVRAKAYNVYDEFFDDSNRLVDIIEKYLQMVVKCTDSQSSLVCQSCYTHLDDFHKFALLVKEKQESLVNEIPTIKLDDTDDEDDVDQEDEGSYIRDTDVLVECKTDVEDNAIRSRDEVDVRSFQNDGLLIATDRYRGSAEYFSDNNASSLSGYDHTPWLTSEEKSYKFKSPSKTAPVRKTPYKTHTPEDRARIVDAANRGDDWSALASELGVKYKTAYTWVSISRKEMFLKSGKISFSEDDIQTVIEWIEENRGMTLKEIVARVKQYMKKDVCVYFVESTLEGRLYQHKRSHDYRPHLMNTLENKSKRCEYVNTLKYYMDLKKTIVWLGETNYKMFCRRAKGRFNTNSTFFATCDPTIYMMGAVTHNKVISIKRSRERMRPEDIFKNWSDDLTNLVIVCDSDYCFSELDEYFNNSEVTLLLLSLYSYMLNPLESIWDRIKSNVKSHPNISQFNSNDIKEQRLVMTEKCIDDLLPTITKDVCERAIKKAHKFHEDILEMRDMSEI